MTLRNRISVGIRAAQAEQIESGTAETGADEDRALNQFQSVNLPSYRTVAP